MSRAPFRAVRHLTVPAVPEGIAISPDGRWIAVQSLDGSNLAPDNPGRHPVEQVVLFEIRDDAAVRVNALPAGAIGQGLAFADDGETLFVELNVEKAVAVYRVLAGRLEDTGQRIRFEGSPVSIATAPR